MSLAANSTNMPRRPPSGPLFLNMTRPVPTVLAGWLISRVLFSPLRWIEIEPLTVLPGFLVLVIGLVGQAQGLNRGIFRLRSTYLVLGIVLDSWAWWVLRPGTGAAVGITGPWDVHVVSLSTVSLLAGLGVVATLGFIGGSRGPRGRWFPNGTERAAVWVGALGAIGAYRASFFLMGDLPNEERSMVVAGCEIHHALLGTAVLVTVQLMLASRLVRPGRIVMLVYGIAAGTILDQLTYLMLTNCSDEAYGGSLSWSGAIAGYAVLCLLVIRESGWLGRSRVPTSSSQKLLSHRLRGFSEFEHSPSALHEAIRSGVHYLEVDTRTTSDGQIYLYHDPVTGPEISRRVEIARSTSTEVEALRFRNGDPMLPLERALSVFAEQSQRQILCLDIKDLGQEEAHLAQVRDAGIEDRICWVSWIPQTLLRLDALGATSPLLLSHFNLHGLRAVGSSLSGWLGDRPLRMGHFVVLGREACSIPLHGLESGYQHALVASDLPDDLVEVLAGSGGGICVPKMLVGPRLTQYTQQHGLQLWTFSVLGSGAFVRYASRPGVDVVFCDDAASPDFR